MEKNPHKGHRKRVRDEFLVHGFDDKTPYHKIIEMLLFYCVPRKDTNLIAHAIEERFKNLEALFEATPEEIKEIDGLNDNAVAFFKLLVFITGKYRSEKITKTRKFTNLEAITNFLSSKYTGFTQEAFGITTFNNKGDFIAFDFVKRGDVSSVAVSTREVIEAVLKRNASGVIISHNHPGGTALPSPDDLTLTKRIFEALKHIDVSLIDHIIVSNDDYVSLRLSADYKHLFS